MGSSAGGMASRKASKVMRLAERTALMPAPPLLCMADRRTTQ